MTTRQSPTVDPDAEHLQLVTAQWYQRRSFGRTLGRILLLSGAGIAVLAWLRGSHRARTYVVSAIASIFGVGLITKKYMNDPEALREYLQEFKAKPFVESIAKWDWDSLKKIASVENIRSKLIDEIVAKNMGFDDIWNTYHSEVLNHVLSDRVLSKEFLKERFELDVQHHATPCLLRMCRYGLWLVDKLDIDKSFITSLIVADDKSRDYSFTELIQIGARPLVERQLLSAHVLRDRALMDLRTGLLTLDLVARDYAPWIVDQGLLTPEELAEYLQREIVRLNAAELLTKYWSWPIASHGERMGLTTGHVLKLRTLHEQLTVAKNRRKQRKSRAKSRAREEESAARDVYEARVRELKSELERALAGDHVTESERSALTERCELKVKSARSEFEEKVGKIAHTRDDELRACEHEWSTSQGAVNSAWVDHVTNNPSNHVTVVYNNVVINNSTSVANNTSVVNNNNNNNVAVGLPSAPPM
jgi:hypothetical protein